MTRREDLVDVLRHAADQTVRTTQGRSPAKHESHVQRIQLDGGDRRERPDDVEILLDQRRARQPEKRLDFEQLLEGRFTAQAAAPHSDSEAAARNALSPARQD
jgi:hypothetical protein